jgi:parallel beta-helix repeat protein
MRKPTVKKIQIAKFLKPRVLALPLISCALSLLTHQPAWSAQSYYVSVGGNDSNTGTIDSPFKSIQYAVYRTKPGDTVYVRGGVYDLGKEMGENNGIDIGASNAGTPNAPITLRSYPGEEVALDGSSIDPNKYSPSCIEIYQTRHIVVKGFECRNSKRDGIVSWGSSYVQIQNNVIHDVPAAGITVGNSRMNEVYDVLVQGNTVYNTNLQNRGTIGQGIQTLRSNNVRIVGNRVYNNLGEGIVCYLAKNCLAAYNVVYDNYGIQMYMDNATNSTFENNFIYNRGDSRFFYRGQRAVGIQMANENYGADSNPLSENIVRNNIVIGGFAGFRYGAYQNGGGMKNSLIMNNTFYGATNSMLNIEPDAHSGTVIANNIFHQTNGVSMTSFFSNPGSITFQNNLWYGGSAGAAAGPGDINANPLLVRPGIFEMGGYKLQSQSPAIDKGTPWGSMNRDFFGSSRPVGAGLDIGAHEMR